MFCSAARHRGPKCVIVKVDESWLCGTGWLDAYIDIHICCFARLLEHIVLGCVLCSISGVRQTDTSVVVLAGIVVYVVVVWHLLGFGLMMVCVLL